MTEATRKLEKEAHDDILGSSSTSNSSCSARKAAVPADLGQYLQSERIGADAYLRALDRQNVTGFSVDEEEAAFAHSTTPRGLRRLLQLLQASARRVARHAKQPSASLCIALCRRVADGLLFAATNSGSNPTESVSTLAIGAADAFAKQSAGSADYRFDMLKLCLWGLSARRGLTIADTLTAVKFVSVHNTGQAKRKAIRSPERSNVLECLIGVPVKVGKVANTLGLLAPLTADLQREQSENYRVTRERDRQAKELAESTHLARDFQEQLAVALRDRDRLIQDLDARDRNLQHSRSVAKQDLRALRGKIAKMLDGDLRVRYLMH